MKDVRKLYILSDSLDGKQDINGMYLLIDDTGKILYTHFCSSKYYAIKDLITSNKKRMNECSNTYGSDFKILYLGKDDMTLDKLVKLHNQNYNE